MTTDVMEYMEEIRKMMGWCPQKNNDILSAPTVNFARFLKLNPRKSSGFIEQVDVPLQMFDWRVWAILLGFMGLIIFSIASALEYSYIVLLSFSLMTLLFLLFHTKLSVGNEKLRIATPILKDVIIPLNSIQSIEIFENYGNRHKLRSLVSMAIMILLSINLAVTFQESFLNKLYIPVTAVFAYLFYFTIRISAYPDMIRMNAGGREILLYPRNEHDFLMLKSIALAGRIDKRG